MFGSTWGQQNNQQQQQQQQQPPQQGGLFGASAGGGFGQTTGFGQQQTTGFGQPAQQNTGLFGSAPAQNTGFGGFGGNTQQQQPQQQTNAFGAARPAFGATGTSPFGQSNANTGGGMFGSPAAPTTFGAPANTSTASGGLFAAKPATGFGTASTSTLFGAKPATQSTFGVIGGGSPAPSNQVFNYTTNPPPPLAQTGTANPPYQPTWLREPPPGLGKEMPPPHLFHVINAMEPYRGGSFEELRMMDYQQGRKDAGSQPPAATQFGAPVAQGGFGQPAATSTFGQPAASSSTFGAPKPAGGLFGASSTGFGATTNTAGGFGSTQGTTGGNLFGQQQQPAQTTSLFGQPAAANPSGGIFGQQPAQTNTAGGMFGNTNPFGQNTQQQQQQQPASTGFGTFGAAKPAFGSTTTTTGFGQPAAASNTFGQTPASTGFGFGQQNQPQQQQQPAGGLFGGSTFGASSAQPNTSTSLFGQPQQQQQQQQPASGGLFGAASKPTGNLFGSTPTPAANSGFGTFGQTNPVPATQSSSGLFGSTATPATGGLFGAPQQQTQQQPATGSIFGGNTGSSLFSAPKPAAPTTGGLFGATQPAQQQVNQAGSSPFGFNQPAAGGGMFGNSTLQANTNSLAPKPAGSLFGGGTSMFGQQAQQPTQQAVGSTGLFGALGQSQQAAPSMFGNQQNGPSTMGQSTGLFGSVLGQSNAAPQQLQQLSASVDQNPYGRNDLFAYQGQKLELGSQNKKPALPPLTASSFRVTPTKGRLTKLRGFASPLNASQSPARAASPAASSPARTLGSPAPSDRYKGLTDAALSPNAFIPRASVKKITVAPKTINGAGVEDPLESILGKSALRNSINGSAPPTPDHGTPTVVAPVAPRPPIEDTPTRRIVSVAVPDSSIRVSVSERPLKRGDYWCRPKLDKLRLMSHEELSKLEGFSAGRKGYGEVTFLESVDLTGLASLHDLLGSVIVVEDLELAVYPEDRNKPERGKGLNVPAQISLENCFARDKATRQPVTDPSDPRYQRQLKRVKAVADTEFISFTEDGVWTFRVDHFSRYGLGGSDDEDEDEDADAEYVAFAPKTDEVFENSYSGTSEDDIDENDDDFLPPTKSIHDQDIPDPEHDSGMEELDDDDSFDDEEEMDGDVIEDRVPELLPEWDQPLKAKLGVEGMRKLREMQSSFFGNASEKRTIPRQPPNTERAKRDAAFEAKRAVERKRFEADFGEAEEGVSRLDDRAVKRASFGQIASPPLLRQPCKYSKVPLEKSTVNGNEGIIADAGLSFGRSFRCSWGPNGELVHFGKICSPTTKFVSSPDAVVFIEHVELLAEPETVEQVRAERLLKLQLEHTAVDFVDGVPVAMIDTSLRFFQFAKLFDSSDRSQEASIWRLGHALFDEVDLALSVDTPDDVRLRIAEVRRKLALSKWLEDAVAPSVDQDLAKVGDNRPAKVFALLTGNQVDRAVQSALDGNDMRLASLISQIGGPEVFRQEVLHQLNDWQKFKASSLIGYDYRKLYALIAGVTDISTGDSSRGSDAAPDVLVAEGLDWKRAFGLRLWYGCPFEDTIAQVLDNYSAALAFAHPPARPLPPYLEKPDDGKKWTLPSMPTDVLFNLITMYGDLTIPLDEVLGARDASSSPTDLRLPWHIYLVLSRALAKRDFADREDTNDDGIAYSATADRITTSYANQLENAGLPIWSAFVLLFLERPEKRRVAIRALLFRHPDLSTADTEFLVGTLRIPKEWLHESMAAQLASVDDAYREYFELIRARLSDRAHRVLVSKLAPEAVLRGDHGLLRRLCEALEEYQPNGWEYGGKLFLEYLDLIDRVQPLLQSVIRAGVHPDPHEASTLAGLASSLPRVLKLLPALFPDKGDVHQIATLNAMLSGLHSLAGVLQMAGYIERPPVSDLLVDKDRLHLLQDVATEAFERSLLALTA